MKKILFTIFAVIVFNSVSGQNAWERNAGPVGTRVSSVLRFNGKIYAGTTGGIFTSNDEGLTWQPDTNGMYAGRYISSMATNGQTLVAATPYGVYYKTGNNPWQLSDMLNNTSAVISNGQVFLAKEYSFFDVSVSSDGIHWEYTGYATNAMGTNGSTLFLGGYGGDELLRSTDNGSTWESIYEQQGSYSDIAGNGNVLMVATYLGGMLRSTDNGNTFTQVEVPIGSFTELNAYNITFDGNMVYASVQASKNEMYYSQDYGQTWQKRNEGLNPPVFAYDAIIEGGHIIAGSNEGIYLSENGGETWTFDGSNGLANSYVKDMLISNGSMHALTGTSILGGSFGLYSSQDAGETWNIQQMNNFGNNGNLHFGTVVNDVLLVKNLYTLSRSTDDGLTWTNILTAPTINMTALYTSGGRVLASTFTDKIYYSDDSGLTWVQSPSAKAIVNGFASRGGVIYAGGYLGVQKSVDNGTTWTNLPAIMNGSYDVIAIAANDQYLFAAVQSGGTYVQLYRSGDNGQTWQNIHSGLPQGVWNKIAVNGNDILVGTNPAGADFIASYLYKSTNNGTTWESFRQGMFVDSDITYLGFHDGKWWAGTESAGLWSVSAEALGTGDSPSQAVADIMVYPNPVADVMNVHLTGNSVPDAVILTDMNGRKIRSWKKTGLDNNALSLDMQDIAPGLYFVNVIVQGNSFSCKVYKQ